MEKSRIWWKSWSWSRATLVLIASKLKSESFKISKAREQHQFCSRVSQSQQSRISRLIAIKVTYWSRSRSAKIRVFGRLWIFKCKFKCKSYKCILLTARNPNWRLIATIHHRESKKQGVRERDYCGGPDPSFPNYSSSTFLLCFVTALFIIIIWFLLCLSWTNFLLGLQWKFSDTFYGVVYSYSSSHYMLCDLMWFMLNAFKYLITI